MHINKLGPVSILGTKNRAKISSNTLVRIFAYIQISYMRLCAR